MPRDNEAEFLEAALKGNRSAIEFCQMVFRISQTWDDLVDRDNPVPTETINRCFWEALIGLHENAFFLQFHQDLVPLMRQYAIDYMDSSELEHRDDDDRNIAFVLRDSIGAVVIQCAYLIGGYDWMQHVSLQIRHHIFEESLASYKSKLEIKS